MITKLRKPVLSALVFSFVGVITMTSFAATPGPATPAPAYQVGDRWTYQAQDGFPANGNGSRPKK